MIAEEYQDRHEEVREHFQKEGYVLLEEFIRIDKRLQESLRELEFANTHEPTIGKYSSCKGVELDLIFHHVRAWLIKLFSGQDVSLEVLKCGTGEYLLQNDARALEKGIVAFLDLSAAWNVEWGGYLGIGQEAIPLQPGSLFIAHLRDKQWFIKYVNHHAVNEKILLVIRQK